MKQLSLICAMLFFIPTYAPPCALADAPELTDAEQEMVWRLVHHLDSDDPQTLDGALQGLLAMGPKAESALDRLTEMLPDGRQLSYDTVRYRSLERGFQVNVSVVGVLRSIGSKAVPALAKAMKNEDERVRLNAIQALMHLRESVDLEVWLEGVKDSTPSVRIYAARELGKSDSPISIDALCKALQDEDLQVRIEVAKALGQVGDERAINPLLDALQDPQLHVQYTVGEALGNIGEEAVRVLLQRIDSFDEGGRLAVGAAIRKLHAQQNRPLLLECLENRHWEVRSDAIQVLARLKTPESLRVVTDSLEDSDWHVRAAAVRLLDGWVDDETVDSLRANLLQMANNDPAARVRSGALRTLHSFPGIPTKEYWDTLEAALDDESPWVRSEAATSCAKHPNPRFAARLQELLSDEDWSVRREAAWALGPIKAHDAVPDLIRLLDDDNDYCANAAAYSLGRLGTDEAVDALAAQLHDTKSHWRRSSALHGLLLTNNPKAIAPLRAALKDRFFRGQHQKIEKVLEDLAKE